MSNNTIANLKFKKHIFVIIECGFLLCSVIRVNAQQTPLYSQYTFSPFVLNPAAAGAEGYTTINLTSRNQWVGIEGAPRIYSASVQTRVMKQGLIRHNMPMKRRYNQLFHNGRVGLGLNFYNYHAGQIDQTGAQITYAYHYNFNGNSQLSMGITLGFLKFKVNANKLQLIDMMDDPVYINNKVSFYIPDANIGLYYSDRNKYIGFSILQLLQASIHISNYDDEDFLIYRQFYLVGGYQYSLNSKDVLEASVYLKSSEQLRFQIDASIKFIHNSMFWIGLGYRSELTFIGSTGLSINRFYFGYAYDYSPKGLLNNSYGSHEVMLALKLGDNVRRYRYLDRY